jgi:hypothetical protein
MNAEMVGWMAARLVHQMAAPWTAQKVDQMVVEKAGSRAGWLVDWMVVH